MRWLVMIAATAAIAFPRFASAWNDTGHMTVALIAYRQLDDAQRQKVAEILKTHPHYELYLTARRPDGVSAEEWAFMRASTWPDFVRPSRGGREGELFKGPEITHFHQGPWHYITIPWVPYSERKKIDPTTLPSKPEPNILTAMDGAAKQLRSGDTKMEDKAVALAWLEHLIGDVHQPLHATTVFSSVYPNGDRGGNEEAVRTSGGAVMRLHSFWDESLGTSDAFTAIDFLAGQITGDPQLEPSKLSELSKHTSFSSWVDESNECGIAIAHLNGRLRSAPYADYDTGDLWANDVPALPPAYEINAHDLAKRRVALAGYRLAEQIKSLLGK